MFHLVVVGAGPAGISLAVEATTAGIAGEKILILEKAEAHSWSIRKFYPEQKLVTANFKGLEAICHGVMCIRDMSTGDAQLPRPRHYGESTPSQISGVSWFYSA